MSLRQGFTLFYQMLWCIEIGSIVVLELAVQISIRLAIERPGKIDCNLDCLISKLGFLAIRIAIQTAIQLIHSSIRGTLYALRTPVRCGFV